MNLTRVHAVEIRLGAIAPCGMARKGTIVSSIDLTRRVVNRSLLALWRQRGSLVLCGGAAVALIGYAAATAPHASGSAAPSASAATQDCADAVMAAVVGHGAPTVQQQAFQCMDPALQQQVFDQGLAGQYRALASAAVSNVSRVATHTDDDGAELVYYAANAGNQSVGFVVHLGADGKATMIS